MKNYDEPSTIGGHDVPPEMLRPFTIPFDVDPDDILGRRIFQMLNLHPVLQQYRPDDLTKMTNEEKEALLRLMRSKLGIRELKHN